MAIEPPLAANAPAPVELSWMPLAAPLVDTLSNVTPLAPMVTAVIVTPSPVVVVMLLVIAPVSTTLTVPAVVAANAAWVPVVRLSPVSYTHLTLPTNREV